MEDKAALDAIFSLLAVCDAKTGSLEDALRMLELTWLERAECARSRALVVRGGFRAEQASQLEQLARMVQFVREDRPDMELEGLFQEGDLAGVVRHMDKGRDVPDE
jgi:hypothetical protein